MVPYVNNTWEPVVTEPLLEDANCLHISLNSQVNVFPIYRSSSFKDITAFRNFLEFNINSIKSSLCTIVTGDINIYILSDSGSPQLEASMKYLYLFAELDLIPTINKPTKENLRLDHVHATSRHHAVGLTISEFTI